MKKLSLILLLLPAIVLADTATLTWTQPAANTDGSTIAAGEIISNTIYKGVKPDGTDLVFLKTIPATTTSVDIVGVGTWCYAVTATVAVEGAKSNVVCKTVLPKIPGPPRITTVAVVAGLSDTPAYKILADGQRSSAVAGFVTVGTECAGNVVFTYRSKGYRKVPAEAVRWWGTTKTDQVAAACSG